METWVWVVVLVLLADLAITFFVMRRVLARRRARDEETSPEATSRDMGLG